MLNGLDLFSGIGGGAIALAPWVRPVAYCESYEPAQNNLLELQQKGEIQVAPIWDDLRSLERRHLPIPVDIIYGGWPCQEISSAGTRKGLDGERSGLVFEVFRLIREFRPSWIFLENSPNITVSGLSRILLELDALGFDARWTIVSAEEMGAPHLRERFWLLAHANGKCIRKQPKPIKRIEDTALPKYTCEESITDSSGLRWRTWRPEFEQPRKVKATSTGNSNSDSLSEGRQRWLDAEGAWQTLSLSSSSSSSSWPSWLPQPCISRGHHGLSNRMDRIHGLGNAWVPQVAREAFIRLMGY